MQSPAQQDLSGQVALVTGAASGIGRAVALAMAAAGADIVVNYVSSPERAEEVASEIRKLGRAALACRADISSEADVTRLFEETRARFGTLDILVANAGVQADAALVDMTLAQWEKVLAVDLTGQFLCARAAAREFVRRGKRPVSAATGKIICMSSVHQEVPWSGHVNYAAAKSGVRGLMRTLAQELAPAGIRVNAIAPGAIRTNINRAAWSTDAALQKLLTLIPYGRVGDPEDVGRAAVWLASDASDYVIGTTLYIDGGMSLFPAFIGNG